MGSRTKAAAALAVLVLINTVNYMDRNVINILLPRIRDHLDLSDTSLGLLGGAAFTVFYALAALPIGWAVDRYPRRVILAAGLLVWSAATFASGTAATFGLLFAARALTGSGEATAHPAGVSVLGDWFTERRRTVAIAIFQAGVAIGGGVGVIVGGHLAAAFDWRVTLMIFAFAGAALSPLAVLMPEPARGARVAGTDGYASTIQRFLGIRTLVLHYAATVFVMFALQGYAVWMPSFLERHRGFGLEEIANLAGAATLAGGVVGGILGGFLADWLYSRDRRGRLAVQTGAALLAAPCMLLSVLAHGRIPIIAGLFASMILLVVMFPILSAVIVDLVDAGDRGKAMAILLLAQTGLGFSLGPLVVGWVSDSTGSLLLGLAAPPAALVMVVVLGALGLGSVRRDVEAREARARP